MIDYPLPLIGFCAYSGTGKTTLLTQLLELLSKQGLRIGMIKHAHHDFDIDHPGKDSYKLRKAGAEQMLIVSSQRLAMIREFASAQQEPNLPRALQTLDPDSLDLILVEGFKSERFPKIELHRPELNKDLIFPGDDSVIAIASNANAETLKLDQYEHHPQLLNLDNPQEIAQFILKYLEYGNTNNKQARQTQ
jgi:molybdopterin-guanine dinucleotide biosynthesis protein MobB